MYVVVSPRAKRQQWRKVRLVIPVLEAHGRCRPGQTGVPANHIAGLAEMVDTRAKATFSLGLLLL